MRQHYSRILIFLIACLLANLIPVVAQAPESYIISIWTFDQMIRHQQGKQLPADHNNQPLPATLTMIEGIVDPDGQAGTPFFDNTCAIEYEPSLAIRWDDVRGESEEDSADDARVLITASTTDWEDLALRFYYQSERVESFDLSYHLGDEQWTRIADDVVIDRNDEWNNIQVGLTDFEDIENREKVVFLIHDMIGDFTHGKFRLDNVALLGKRISRQLDCPPILQEVNSIPDISIRLNSASIPTFTGENGFQFLVTDDNTAFNDLTIMALTSDPNVINQLGLTVIDAETGIFQLDIGSPHGYTGVSDITLQIQDESGNVIERVIQYGVSNAPDDDTITYHQGTASASAGVALDSNYMLIANDRTQVISVYSTQESDAPLTSINFSDFLNLPDRYSDGRYHAVDIEGATQIGNRQYWIGSHSNNNNGQRISNSYRLFITETQGQGADTTITFIGYHDRFFNELARWGDENGYVISQVLANDIPGNSPNGLNIEALSFAPDGQTMYIGFRAPLIENRALIAPVQNFIPWIKEGAPTESATFGTPIELDLGGLGIRGMECNSNGCIISAGSLNEADEFALYRWSGNPADAPIRLSTDLTGMRPEAIILSPGNNLASGSQIQLISDNSTTDWYGSGSNTSRYHPNLQFFRADLITLD